MPDLNSERVDIMRVEPRSALPEDGCYHAPIPALGGPSTARIVQLHGQSGVKDRAACDNCIRRRSFMLRH